MEYSFTPIGFVRTRERFEYEVPRQGVFADNTGAIELLPGCNYEQALEDLSGFDRIWVVFVFDRNNHWSPKTRPPVGAGGRAVGTFATRAPYRPNNLGLSAVKLLAVRGRTLDIANFDMLDGTPVLDIKPYIPAADAFVDSRTGWMQEHKPYQVVLSPEFLHAAAKLTELGGVDMAGFARVQLAVFDPERQRIGKMNDGREEIGCRTWKIGFVRNAEQRRIQVEYLRSSYSRRELENPDDPYREKPLHRTMIGLGLEKE